MQFVNKNSDTVSTDEFMRRQRQLRRKVNRGAPRLLFKLKSDDGFEIQSHSLQEVWSKVFEEVWLKRVERGILQKSISPADGDLIGGNWRVFSKIDNMNSLKLSGLSFDSLIFLLEQIPSAKFCSKYKFKFFNLKVQPLQINESGCARCEPREDTRTVIGRRDMFSWLSSRNRRKSECNSQSMADLEYQFANLDKRKTTSEYPIQMRYRNLKKTAKQVCAVFKSDIHGRGLYSLQAIFPDEMIIEYTGEIIRAIHTDKRENYYESKAPIYLNLEDLISQ
ncbi:histone-lysine N-methyltransferase 2B-like isoform X2 [Symsagittifera roscoffensis]|uniref:histone-lysine N-methyltransferase 2B-like isoform X2 n=1 Tax=Symsagittifera roscoffensis TaxID=84072 RepID=UPI00307CBA55